MFDECYCQSCQRETDPGARDKGDMLPSGLRGVMVVVVVATVFSTGEYVLDRICD